MAKVDVNVQSDPVVADGTLALPILPSRGVVVFPYMMTPLVISDQRYAKLIDEALMGGKTIGLFAQRDPEAEAPGPDELYQVGCAGQIVKMLRFPDGSVRFLVQGQARIHIEKVLRTDPYIIAKVADVQAGEEDDRSVEIEALMPKAQAK